MGRNPLSCHTRLVLRVEDLGRKFSGRWIFRNLNFELGAGDGLVVTGRNGSGKSTLLKVISGLLSTSEGRSQFQGDLRLDLGYAGLELALYPSLTATEHLEFSGKSRGVPSRSKEVLEEVGLGHAADKRISQMSSGMKSRLRLALAIQAQPKLLILDEPGVSLDELGKEVVERVCADQKERGTLILATNDPAERRFATHELELAN